jgi:hypothetical protein
MVPISRFVPGRGFDGRIGQADSGSDADTDGRCPSTRRAAPDPGVVCEAHDAAALTVSLDDAVGRLLIPRNPATKRVLGRRTVGSPSCS